MRTFLTPFERIILESLHSKAKTIEELSIDLELNSDSIFFVLQGLVVKDLLEYQKAIYSINKERILDLKVHLENKNSRKFEIKSILESAKESYLEHRDQKALMIKKVYLTASERELANSLFRQLDQFLDSKSKMPKDEPLAKKEIFYWGSKTYNELLNFLHCA
jgi:hypothetical protein